MTEFQLVDVWPSSSHTGHVASRASCVREHDDKRYIRRASVFLLAQATHIIHCTTV